MYNTSGNQIVSNKILNQEKSLEVANYSHQPYNKRTIKKWKVCYEVQANK